MWGMSWANLLMLISATPDSGDDEDEEGEIDLNNIEKYVNS